MLNATCDVRKHLAETEAGKHTCLIHTRKIHIASHFRVLQSKKTLRCYSFAPCFISSTKMERTNERTARARRTPGNSRNFIESNRRKVTGLWGNFRHVLTRKIYVRSASGQGTGNQRPVPALRRRRKRDCHLHLLAVRA